MNAPKPITVYLAGDVRTDWRDGIVKRFCKLAHFVNPCDAALEYPQIGMQGVVRWEIGQLVECDLVFAYIHGGHKDATGTPAEIGFACASNIPIIFADERQDQGTDWLRYLCNSYTTDLNVGIEMLDLLLRGGRRAIAALRRGDPPASTPTIGVRPLVQQVWQELQGKAS